MIRMIQSISASHAKAYFTSALSKSDYYTNGQELEGRLQGRLAERLCLGSEVSKETFFFLSENRNPKTGDQLTPRTTKERRVGYDINFHCPKSVSIVNFLSKDDHIEKAFASSVSKTMKAMERDCQTRVRKDGAFHNRPTEEMIWAEFLHRTARPVDASAPDPHLHMHCFTFNMTWDNEEQRIKAGDFADIKRDMPYFQAFFHKTLSDELIKQGYRIRKTEKSFEIEGVPQKAIDLFSKRTDEIGQFAKEHGINDPKRKSELGVRTRSKKQKGMSMDELKTHWRAQLKTLDGIGEKDLEKPIRFSKVPEKERITDLDCVQHALAHCFERASVMPERRLLEAAIRHGIGDEKTTAQNIEAATKANDRIIRVKDAGRWSLTTKEVLQQEKDMIELAKRGMGKLKPLYRHAPETGLEGHQKNAIEHIMTTPHRVSIVMGAAGTGKTTLLKTAEKLFNEKGKQVTVVAPTAEASKGVLVSDGFEKADTVAKLLMDKKMQEGLMDQVLWVDEAGLLGTKDMKALIGLANDKNAQLVLGGDTRQHSSVVRGDALRILNTVGNIRAAEVSKVYRQNVEKYRTAVEDLSKGKVVSAFGHLKEMGAIKEVDPLKPNVELVNDYIKLVKKRKTALIVSPTHKQADEVTDAIRASMKAAGLLGKKELTAARLTSLNFTEAQKKDWRNYRKGQVIQFNQNCEGAKRGSQWEVSKANESGVEITNDSGLMNTLSKNGTHHFDVLEKSSLKLSKGDKLKITRNSFDNNKTRLNNGQTLEVVSVTKSGKISLRNKQSRKSYEIDKDFGHINHAHCITSHASQGKTVDHVLISQPSSTFTATNSKQFYVSVSRGKKSVGIYTDDKEALLDYASKMGDRLSAIELVNKESKQFDYVMNEIRKQNPEPNKETNRKREFTVNKKMDREYEP